LGRQVNPLQVEGAEVRIFGEAYRELFSSFVHAFRNAVDHGIEPAEEREMAGKGPAGQLTVRCAIINKSNKRWLQIVLQDDGKGIFAEELRKKLKSRYSEEELAKQDDFAIIQHVFDSGVSTKTEIGEFSGRGIGMNAIKAEAEALGGKSWVETEPLVGTKLFVEVPDLSPPAVTKTVAKSA
jgi:two-component system chemotaxis sensor kinase CheA